jgi:putative DNA-invertase from lambdoid prophage Rac
MRKRYYGRISTTDGQSAASQYEDARAHGVDVKDIFIDEGVSGYHVAPEDREQWRKAEHDLRHGGILIVRWLDRISRRYDELHRTMHRLMGLGVRVECTLNGMAFDGKATDPIEKATRDAVLAFMAAQGEADYRNRAEREIQGTYAHPRLRRDSDMAGRKRCEYPCDCRAVQRGHGNRKKGLQRAFG